MPHTYYSGCWWITIALTAPHRPLSASLSNYVIKCGHCAVVVALWKTRQRAVSVEYKLQYRVRVRLHK